MGYKLSRERLRWRLQTLGRMEHSRGSPTSSGGRSGTRQVMLQIKGKRGRKVMFHSAQRVITAPLPTKISLQVGLVQQRKGILQMEVLGGCSSLDAASVPRV